MQSAALGGLLATVSIAWAQGAADAVPEKLDPPPYGQPISLETAKKVAAGAVAEARAHRWDAFCIAVVGPSGDLIYFERQDNAEFAAVTNAQRKARTAARFRQPTLVFEKAIAEGRTVLATLDDMIATRGGNPLIVDGKIVGAIGVGGGTGTQDNLVSQAGVATLR